VVLWVVTLCSLVGGWLPKFLRNIVTTYNTTRRHNRLFSPLWESQIPSLFLSSIPSFAFLYSFISSLYCDTHKFISNITSLYSESAWFSSRLGSYCSDCGLLWCPESLDGKPGGFSSNRLRHVPSTERHCVLATLLLYSPAVLDTNLFSLLFQIRLFVACPLPALKC
jgi:hypothetical protein